MHFKRDIAICVSDSDLDKLRGIDRQSNTFIAVNDADGPVIDWLRRLAVPIIRVTI